MKNFNNYNIEDYLSDSSFRVWISNGGFNQIESEWSTRLCANQDQLTIATQARNIILATQVVQAPVSNKYTEQIVSNTISSIRNSKKRRKSKRIKNWRLPMGIAASISILLISTWYYVRFNAPANTVSQVTADVVNPVLEFNNTTDHVVPIALSDGSSILLDPGSIINYPSKFNSKSRMVTLSGSAFFEVVKNPNQPFFVKTQEMITRVLGTSFKINANKYLENFSVIVKSGKVSIYAENDKKLKSIDLTLNEEGIFNRGKQTLTKKVLESVVVAKSTPENTKTVTYNDIPISQIFESLSDKYQIPITISGSALTDCSLTTTFNDEPLFEKIKIICQAIGPSANFKTEGEQIIISTKGCNN